MKAHTTLTIDQEKLMIAKKLNLNISKVLNDALTAMIGEAAGDPELIAMKDDLEKVKEKEKALAITRSELIARIGAAEMKIKQYEEEELAQKILKAKAMRNADILNEMLDQ